MQAQRRARRDSELINKMQRDGGRCSTSELHMSICKRTHTHTQRERERERERASKQAKKNKIRQKGQKVGMLR